MHRLLAKTILEHLSSTWGRFFSLCHHKYSITHFIQVLISSTRREGCLPRKNLKFWGNIFYIIIKIYFGTCNTI
ncbi:unnamed protein product [Larinioides sclopetarius]|uniref:Uncharacterized protein n=1 Tax=Larinioides sclopetarius TaxID=280406 RepID=A0AAV2A4G9_9ARAC